MDRTSETNLRASSIGKRFNNAVSDGSANHDLIGMALSTMQQRLIILVILTDLHNTDVPLLTLNSTSTRELSAVWTQVATLETLHRSLKSSIWGVFGWQGPRPTFMHTSHEWLVKALISLAKTIFFTSQNCQAYNFITFCTCKG